MNYLFFLNLTQINGYKGFVGFGIRELNLKEFTLYCNKSFSEFPLIQSEVNFTSDFMIRAYSSGCFYFDANTGKWNSEGMAIYDDTNLEYTHCTSNHLTSFAGGLVILPSSINFQFVFDNATFTKNIIVYITIGLVTCFYILFALWSHYMDKQDKKRMNLVFLDDNHPKNTYFYELIVFTGNRSESGTESKVTKSN